MESLIGNILKNYGLSALIVLTLLFIFTWVISHKEAETGSTVNIWGLIEYSKYPLTKSSTTSFFKKNSFILASCYLVLFIIIVWRVVFHISAPGQPIKIWKVTTYGKNAEKSIIRDGKENKAQEKSDSIIVKNKKPPPKNAVENYISPIELGNPYPVGYMDVKLNSNPLLVKSIYPNLDVNNVHTFSLKQGSGMFGYIQFHFIHTMKEPNVNINDLKINKIDFFVKDKFSEKFKKDIVNKLGSDSVSVHSITGELRWENIKGVTVSYNKNIYILSSKEAYQSNISLGK